MATYNSVFACQVPSQNLDQSLLDFMTVRFPYHSREFWSQAICEGRVLLNAKGSLPDVILNKGDTLNYRVENFYEPDLPQDFFQLGSIGPYTWVHKPAGLPVHATQSILFQNLTRLLRLQTGKPHLSPLHRLDADTSGSVVFYNKSEEDASSRSKKTKCWGAPPVKVYGALVKGSLESKEGWWDDYLSEKDKSPIRCQMYLGESGQRSLTRYKVLGESSGVTALMLIPITGRKHQLRAQSAGHGWPLLGDKIYNHGGRYYLKRLTGELTAEDYQELGAPRHLLHAFYHGYPQKDASGQIVSCTGFWDFHLDDSFLTWFDQDFWRVLESLLPEEWDIIREKLNVQTLVCE